jgi:hypothetical protein
MFSVIFCSYIWHWVSWLDQHMLEALYGAGAIAGHPDPAKLVFDLTENAINPEKNLINITISLFYISLPFVWLAIVGWCGIAAAGALSFGGMEALAQRGGSGGLGFTKGSSHVGGKVAGELEEAGVFGTV